jgi:hypothetical protein
MKKKKKHGIYDTNEGNEWQPGRGDYKPVHHGKSPILYGSSDTPTIFNPRSEKFDIH